MAIYSTKIEENVAPDVSFDDTVATEAEIMQEIEDIANEGSFEGVCHGLEAAIQLHESEAQMFDALIEADFISVANEQVLPLEEATVLNEKAADLKNSKVVEAVKERFEAAIRWIKEKAAELVKKIMDIFDKDKNNYKKYSGKLTMENLKGFEGIKDFEFPKKRFEDLEKEMDVDATSYATRAQSSENIQSIKDDIVKDLNSEGLREEYLSKGDWTPSSTDVSDMLDFAKNGGEKMAKTIQKTAAKAIKQFETSKKNYEKQIAKASSGNSSENVTKGIADGASVMSCFCTEAIKKFTAVKNISVIMMQSYRKAIIACGNYCLKQKNVSESMMWAVCESSDQFVAEYFAY